MQRAVRSDYPVAGEPERHGIRANGRADGPWGMRFANVACKPAVAAGLAARDVTQGEPDLALERCALRQVNRELLDRRRLASGVGAEQREGLLLQRMLARAGAGRAQFAMQASSRRWKSVA